MSSKRKLIPFAGAIGALALSASLPAEAALLSLVPESDEVTVGTSFSVDLVATLEPAEDLAAYFADVVYDPLALSFETIEVSDALGTLGVDALDLSLPADVVGGIGIVNATVESLLTDFTTQADVLVLASLTFTATAVGETVLEFGDFPALDDPLLEPLAVDAVGARVSAVPAPAAAGLFALAAGMLAGVRRVV